MAKNLNEIFRGASVRLINGLGRARITTDEELTEASKTGKIPFCGSLYTELVELATANGIPMCAELPDTTRAVQLDQRIRYAAETAQASLWDMCSGLKEMRDTKLYRELGYSSFESYCEERYGISRKQGYQYIAVAEKFSDGNNVTPGLQNAQLGIKKLYLLSTLDEEQREELAESTDLEKTGAAELEKQIKALKSQQAESARKLLDAEGEIKELKKERANYADTTASLRGNIADLVKERDELKNRPLPVQIVEKIPEQYVDISAYERLVNETNAEREENNREYLALKRQLGETERQLEEARNKPAETVRDDTAIYNALMDSAADALDRLAEFVEQAGGDFPGLYDKFMEAHRRTA